MESRSLGTLMILTRCGDELSNDSPKSDRREGFVHNRVNRVVRARLMRVGRDHENGLAGCQLLDLRGQFIAFDKGYFVISDHEVEPSGTKEAERLSTVVGLDDRVRVSREQQA